MYMYMKLGANSNHKFKTYEDLHLIIIHQSLLILTLKVPHTNPHTNPSKFNTILGCDIALGPSALGLYHILRHKPQVLYSVYTTY